MCCDSRDMALSLLILAERFLSVNLRFYLNLLKSDEVKQNGVERK